VPEFGNSLMQVRNVREKVNPIPLQGPELMPALERSNDYSFATSMDRLNMTRKQRPISTPMVFGNFREKADPIAFKAVVENKCADVRDCASGQPFQDCSADTNYDCTNKGESVTLAAGVLTLAFSATVKGSATECGENQCPACTAYRTCAGPRAATKPVNVKNGECVRWEYKSSGAVDWYEIFIGLYDSAGKEVAAIFERGYKTPWAYKQLIIPVDATVNLEFMLGSYDASGGMAVGADLELRNPVYGMCLPEECLKKPPGRCCYTGNDAPLTEEGYAILADCDCGVEMERYIRRVIIDEGLELCLESGLQGMVPWFTCEHSPQSLAVLRTDLHNVQSGILSPNCPWVATVNTCRAEDDLPAGCFASHPPDPTAHRRRACKKKGVPTDLNR
jgi:hypothetical protein